MTAVISVAGRLIGVGQPCFIIAEAGVNHNGDLALAKRLVDASRAVGADAVKFQTWITEKLVAPEAHMARYQKENLGVDQSQFQMLKQLELSQNDFRAIKAHAEQQGLLFFSTPDEEDSADFLEQLNVPLFKIGSAEVTNTPYLRHVAQKGRPMILSTGMSTLGEVEAAIATIEGTGNRQLVLLHCVSNYPASPSECNLRAMDTLRAAFSYPVGFSDHTQGNEVSLAAVARGACVIEKHFTLDKTLPGPDQQASLSPNEFAQLVQSIRIVEDALGDGVKRPTISELETKKVVQKAVVTTRAIRQGEVIRSSDLTLRRTSGGLGVHYMALLVGRHVSRDLDVNATLTWDMIA